MDENSQLIRTVDESPSNKALPAEEPSIRTPAVSRRPDIDFLRIAVVWLILLFHTVLIYTPYPFYYLKDIDTFGSLAVPFLISMDAWNMPMFFFLSGISAYFSLFRRTEKKFREERVHRLLVPAFTLSLTLIPYSFIFFAPLTVNCKEYYNGVKEFNSTLDYKRCEMFYKYTKNDSYEDVLRRFYLPAPGPQQGWFLVYLFVYSQLLATWFCTFHPHHNGDELPGPDFCGRKTSLCTKPFSTPTKIVGCLHFFCKPASTPREFVDAVTWWLGSCAKLAVFPSLWIGIVEAVLRHFFPGGKFHFFDDICNDINFIFIFILGYAITAADEHGLKEVIKKGKWWYLVSGIVALIAYTVTHLFLEKIKAVAPILGVLLRGLLRGPGEWLFILGCYGVCRDLFTKNHRWIPILREIAMPFYLTHQQILVMLASGMLWVPYLSSFPVVLIIATLVTLIISFIITKAGPLRYFFGLPTSLLPGKTLWGFVPLICLVIAYVLVTIIANFA